MTCREEGIQGIITRFHCNLYFLLRKHDCLICPGKLERRKRERIVHSDSLEAKYYDFSVSGTFLWGNIKFITYYFECMECHAVYEIRELIQLERGKRR